MSAPTPPTTILSSFKQLHGGSSQSIAPGEPLVVLGGGTATWWEKDAPVEVALPQNVDPYGSRFKPDRKSLCIGLGALDLAARTWRPEPGLQSFNQMGPGQVYPVKWTAWFADAAHVAIVLESRDARGQRAHEIVIAATDGRVRGRSPLPGMVTAIVASQDRVLVDASKVVLLDLDAKVVAEPKLPRSALRLSEGAGMFAVTLAAHGVALVRPSDGAIVATWDVAANDAVPVPHGVVAVDSDGNVRVGCLDGGGIKEVAKTASGAAGPIIQHVGDRIVVAGGTVDPVHVATFVNPCH